MKMKPYFKLSFILSFILAATTLIAQPEEGTDENTNVTEPVVTKKTEVKKKKTSTFTLGEIIVRDRAIANIEDATTTTEITAKDIEARSNKNLADALEMVPGLQIEQHRKGHIRFNMRGFSMDKIALLVDGIPVTDVYESNTDISSLGVQNASKIIINRGVCSALYGTNGTVGSINIISKRPEKLVAKMSAEYGVFTDYSLNFVHGMPIKLPLGNMYYWLSAGTTHQGEYNVSTRLDKSERRKWHDKLINAAPDLSEEGVSLYLNDTGKWPHTDKTQYMTSGKIGWEIMPGLEVGLNTRFTYQKADRYNITVYGTNEYSDGEWSDPDNILQGSTFTWPEKYVYTFAPYFNYESDFFSIRGNVYYSMDSDFVDAYTNISETEVPWSWGGSHSNWQNSITGFNLFPSFQLAKWNKLNTSILYRFDKHTEKEKVMSNYTSLTGMAAWRGTDLDDYVSTYGYSWFDVGVLEGHQLTLAIEDEIKIKEWIFLTAGISYDAQWLTKFQELENPTDTSLTNQYEVKNDGMIMGTRDSFNPVIGATLKPIKNLLTVRSAFSMKSRFPTLGAYADTYAAVDSGIKVERSYNYNMGAETNLFKGKLVIRGDYFLNRFKDKLERLYIDSSKQYTNIDGVMTQGFELIINGTYKKAFDIADLTYGCSYTFVHSKNQTDMEDTNVNMGDESEETPSHYFTFELRARFTTKTTVGLWGTVTAGEFMYAMDEDLAAPADGTTGGFSTDYFKKVKLHNPVKINLKVEQEFLDHFSGYVMIKNLLDDYNANPFNPGPGIQFFMGVKASL